MNTKGFTLRCTARRMEGGHRHEHIAYLWWVKRVDGKDTNETGCFSRA